MLEKLASAGKLGESDVMQSVRSYDRYFSLTPLSPCGYWRSSLCFSTWPRLSTWLQKTVNAPSIISSRTYSCFIGHVSKQSLARPAENYEYEANSWRSMYDFSTRLYNLLIAFYLSNSCGEGRHCVFFSAALSQESSLHGSAEAFLLWQSYRNYIWLHLKESRRRQWNHLLSNEEGWSECLSGC